MEAYSLIVTMEENVALGIYEHVACFLRKGYQGQGTFHCNCRYFCETRQTFRCCKKELIDEDGVVRQILEKL